MYFDQGEDFKLTTELSEKLQYSRNQLIKSSLNEAILLMKLFFQDKTLRLPRNQDLTLYEGDSSFKRATNRNTHFKNLLTRKQARWPHFLLHFVNFHIMNVNYAKFQKKVW